MRRRSSLLPAGPAAPLGWLLAVTLFATAPSTQAQADREVAAPRFAELARRLELPQPLPVQTAGSGTLDLGTAVQRGIALSPDLEAATARAAQAAAQSDVARGALRPRADLRVAAGRGRWDTPDPDVSNNRQDHNLIVRQVLFDDGARHELSRQRLLAQSAEAQLQQVRQQVKLDIAGAFVTLVRDRVAVKAAEQQEQRLSQLAARLGGQTSAAAVADRERVAARLANVRSATAEARATLQAALRNLERLSGEYPSAVWVASVPEVDLPADERQALQAVREGNPELVALQLESQAAERELAVREARFAPRVELEVGHYRNRNIAGPPGRYEDTRALAVLTLPLANGGADVAARRVALARVAEANARVRGAERRLTQEVETAYSDLQSLAERHAAIASELASNLRLADTYSAQPTGADLLVSDVVDAFQRLAQSQNDLAQVQVSLAQTRWRIARLTGRLEIGP